MVVFGLISLPLSGHWRELRSVYVLQVLRLQLVLEADYRVKQTHVLVVSCAHVLHMHWVGLRRRQLAVDSLPIGPNAGGHHMAHRHVAQLSRCEQHLSQSLVQLALVG